ncbi:RNA polymerase sigma factor [Nocardioides flavus (ex Wang et al. 2016)]|uniref:RNA polymerase sigma factor n=1 Tax=Nocardioides flavus (ex Wang et al. 2016) TaxID=2058780 RepID=A0ABQ3HQC9_9ACTN|nr:SigB/SigF/SigG family RNA polymerase sigma factor [Nocardioides flavus (ex Wang et al. 2016)]GHE18344.1 RNA polymerase sigma factor [Nocardioides flavus (ex Wang et al. 2016)]
MTTLAMPHRQQPEHARVHSITTRGEARATRTSRVVAGLRDTISESERQRLVDELIEANVGMARSMAARYRNRGIDLEDLQQVALVGLTKAAQRFDASSGHDFLSYAVPTVRGELRRHFRDSGWMIRVPRRVQDLQARIRRAQPDLEARLGRSPRPSEVAEHLNVDLDDVVEALSATGCFRPTSIDTPTGNGTDTIADLLGWDDAGLVSVEARLVLGTAISQLSEREQRILQWRFVDERTQQEIADLVGLTQAQVSRILTRVLARLRAGLSEPRPAA